MKRLSVLLSALLAAASLAACNGGSPAFNPAAGNLSASARSRGVAGPDRKGSNYKLLYAFKGTPDGASPYSGLVAVGNTLYGTTLNGSSNYCSQSCGSNNCYLGCGTVFSLNGETERVVYNFKGNFNGGSDGSWPFPGLTPVKTKMYGTTSSAGKYGHGTVFSVDTSGNEEVLYSFMGSDDGAAPEARLSLWKGDQLVGTTVIGGGTGCGGAGCGTVYLMTTRGKESLLYGFKGGTDGAKVYAPIEIIGDTFYGASLEGGQGCGTTGCGTIFSVTPEGKKHTMYRFTGGADGAYPNGLTAAGNVLYGTTEGGGSKNSGTFFSITRGGRFRSLYSFKDIPDGNLPGARLYAAGDSFYGTTVGGGTSGNGTVFKVNAAGTKEQVLYSFAGGSDGADPQGPVYLFNRWLYGTTTKGGGTGCGGSGCGTVFKVKP